MHSEGHGGEQGMSCLPKSPNLGKLGSQISKHPGWTELRGYTYSGEMRNQQYASHEQDLKAHNLVGT